MKRTFAASFLVVSLMFGCRSGGDLKKPQTQENFGVQMARMNLWREAQFRFQRAIEIEPQNAMAHNNLAVAYEANGEFEKARREYLEALRLDKGNQYIQKNYSRYTEFLQRNKKRQQKGSVTASTTAAPAAKPASASNPPLAPIPAAAAPPAATTPGGEAPVAPQPPPPPQPPNGGSR